MIKVANEESSVVEIFTVDGALVTGVTASVPISHTLPDKIQFACKNNTYVPIRNESDFTL
ncbi:hypothetical protein HF888_11490 [Bermanella marisrubri]|uniref:hypothetical protein n=1 Tax=Bermanella marisrubri TaxID=207949 RepID=UPI00105A7050|nr:hypothetical protein [Bermanella marisrubri]QIZ84805.1 hypothetical protein HF888_11490 [Bermanella marisrubri]